jgi:hypothetical protein
LPTPTFSEVLTLYTPAVQIGVLYLFLYRHDLLRFLHPLKEKRGPNAWAETFLQLGVLKEREALKLTDIEGAERNKGKVAFALKLVLPSAFLWFLSIWLFLPVLGSALPSLSRFGPSLLLLLQFIPAAYLLAFLRQNYLGPLPIPPHRSTLPLPRMSSMVKWLGENEEEQDESGE